MKFTVISLISTVAAQDPLACMENADCKNEDILAFLRDNADMKQYQFTIEDLRCGELEGKNEKGEEYSTKGCGPVDLCDMSGTSDGSTYSITCPEAAKKLFISASVALLSVAYAL